MNRIEGSHHALRTIALICSAIITLSCTVGSNDDSADRAPRIATIDSSAAAVIGSDSSALYQIMSGFFLGDSVLLAERSTSSLRLYAPDGHFIRAVGARGSGPGDFAFLLWAQPSSDRIFAYDAALRRLDVFAKDLTFLKSIPVQVPDQFGSAFAIGVFADHSILLGARRHRETVRQPTVVRARLTLLRADSAMNQVDSLVTVAGQERFVMPFGRAGESTAPLVFGREGAIAIGARDYYVVENDSAVVARYGQDGGSHGLLRPDFRTSVRTVTAADVAIARQRFIAPETPELPLAPIFDAMPVPDSFPPFGWSGHYTLRPLRVHGDGTVWVLHFGGVRSTDPTWTVFDTGGTELGHVHGTTEMDVLDSRGGDVLILRHGDADQEIVEVRHIEGW